MLLFRFEKAGEEWVVGDPNSLETRHVHCENRDKAWHYAEAEVFKGIAGKTRFTLIVELEDATG
jgi:hypothetical protein